ncbi:hypothetical protein HDU67_002179, partial [Dinochytrium kinnereticum]
MPSRILRNQDSAIDITSAPERPYSAPKRFLHLRNSSISTSDTLTVSPCSNRSTPSPASPISIRSRESTAEKKQIAGPRPLPDRMVGGRGQKSRTKEATLKEVCTTSVSLDRGTLSQTALEKSASVGNQTFKTYRRRQSSLPTKKGTPGSTATSAPEGKDDGLSGWKKFVGSFKTSVPGTPTTLDPSGTLSPTAVSRRFMKRRSTPVLAGKDVLAVVEASREPVVKTSDKYVVVGPDADTAALDLVLQHTVRKMSVETVDSAATTTVSTAQNRSKASVDDGESLTATTSVSGAGFSPQTSVAPMPNM